MTDALPLPPTLQAVEMCKHVTGLSTDPQRVGQSGMSSHFSSFASKVLVGQAAVRKLEEAWQKDCAIHQANIPALDNNKLVRDRVTAIMKAVGIPDSYLEVDPRSRARFPKRIRHDAGYLGDLRRNVPTGDGFAQAEARYHDLKPRFDKFLADAEQEAERQSGAQQREEERRRAELRANVELAQIKIRYALPPELDWRETLDEIRKRDQRLDLAVAMLQTRVDWSEGFWRVESAMGRFKIEDTTDKDIAACVVSRMDQDDGRVFRDCEWNYDRLFADARDPQLAADIQMCLAHVEAD